MNGDPAPDISGATTGSALVRGGEPYVDLRQYVEALFREKERALLLADIEREKAAQALRESMTRRLEEHYDRLHEMIEMLFAEKERALEMAAAERDRSAAVLRDEQRRAMATAEAEREKAAGVLRDAMDENYQRLHELLLTLFAEKDRALEMASTEREKAASVLRDEQHRALSQAEKEREKAANALQVSLSQSIREGDDRLREHIANQIQQINASLKSGELLEIQRVRGVRDELVERIAANTREFLQIQTAAQEAVKKAEEAQLRVNQGADELRQQLTTSALTLMPRRESEAKHDAHVVAIRELRDELGNLRTELAVGPAGLSELSRQASHHEGEREHKQSSQTQTLTLLGVAAAIGLVVVEFATRGH